MGSVIDAIVDVFEAVVAITLTVTLIGPILAQISPEFKDWYVDALAPVMSLFGINDEDVISAQVNDQLLMEDDNIKNLLTKIALAHQDTQQGIIELLSQYSMHAKGSMQNYYDYGDTEYINGLPDTNIRASVIPAMVYTVIAQEYGVSIAHPITQYIKVPTKEEYLYWKLNKLYGFQTWTNTLVYTDLQYRLKYMDYNYSTDKYDITMYRDAAEETEITITITPFDATQDNKNIHTVVTVHTVEGDIVTSATSTDSLIPKDTEISSYSTTSIPIEYETIVISIVAYAPKLNYVITWYDTIPGNVMYWCYEIGSGNTSIDNAIRYITELEMLPIVELRNNKINVNNNPLNETYLDGKDMLKYLGVDIDLMIDSINQSPSINDVTNAYVYFGVDIADQAESVKKYMYNTFEFLYDQNLVDAATQRYSARTTEGNFNSVMIWKSQTRTVVNGVLGPLNTYQSLVVGNTLILRKQETPEQYVEYQIIDIGATTFIHEGGLWATVQQTLQNGKIVMPVSRFLADNMTPLEQMELFARSLRLATYAAQVTHLEWYETEDFMQLMQIVVYIAAVVLFVLSLPAGGSAGDIALAAGEGLLVGLAASYALKLLLEMTDNPWLKALIAVAAIVAGSLYGGMYDLESVITMTVDQWVNITTEYYQTSLMDVIDAIAAFGTMAKSKFDELEKKTEDLAGYLDTEFISALQIANEPKGYIEGIDMSIYRAVGLQKDVYDIVKMQYDNLYDFNKYFKLGII